MATSPQPSSPAASTASGRLPIRLALSEDTAATPVAGAWWPQSRVLQDEAADLVDHFPETIGRINRLLFSRPDWDNSHVAHRGVRQIVAARGAVKVGSFPSDDTHLMVVTLASGARLKLLVIAPDAPAAEAQQHLATFGANSGHSEEKQWARWDNESPSL